MEVAVLKPHDCLKRYPHHDHHHHNQRRRYSTTVNSNPNPNGNLNGNPNGNSHRSKRRKRNSNSNFSNGPFSKAQQTRSKSPPIMGHVRLLKRGEELKQETIRARPGPVLYAGSGYITSPAPSEVPLPAFFGNKTNKEIIASELRRVLKLI